MYLPNKITSVLSKISESYIAEYSDGKIESVSISDKNIKVDASSKGYCISIKGRDIYLDNIQQLEPLLIKIGAIKKSTNKIKKDNIINDNIIELLSNKKNSFLVEYKLGKVVSIEMKCPKLIVKKNSIGYLLSVNSETISIDNLTSLKKLLQKINIIDKDTDKKQKNIEDLGFEQLKLDLEFYI